MPYSRLWTDRPLKCSKPLDPFYDSYPECSRPCLACPDYDWTYHDSTCSSAPPNASVLAPCCPVPERPWHFSHYDVWECVRDQCEERNNDGTHYEKAQLAFNQWGNFCSEEKTPLYEYWKGTHFNLLYDMQDIDFVPVPTTEVAVSGYYGWGVLAAWHLALLAATVAGLRRIPPPKPTCVITLSSFSWRRVCRRMVLLFRWHLRADFEFILAVVVVWIAIGDISLRAEKVSPMDVFAWPRIDAVPHGYDSIQATHLLTVRAAMGVLDNFICVAIGIIGASLAGEIYFTEPAPPCLRRPVFRAAAVVITIFAGAAVTSKRGVCLRASKLGCKPNDMLDRDVLTLGLAWMQDVAAGQGKPTQLLHFVGGKWLTWPIRENTLAAWMFDMYVPLSGIGALVLSYNLSKEYVWSSTRLGRLRNKGRMPSVLFYLAATVMALSSLVVAFAVGLATATAFLTPLFGLVYTIKVFAAPKAVLGPSPNVSFWDLDQILAAIIGGITALGSIWGSLYSFMLFWAEKSGFMSYEPIAQSEEAAMATAATLSDTALENRLPPDRCRSLRPSNSFATLFVVTDAHNFNMSAWLPERFRGQPAEPKTAPAAPSWINKKITPLLQTFTKTAVSHPIHTVVVVALLASTSYIGLLQESLFDASSSVGKADWSSLLDGSRVLRAGCDTAWKWQAVEQHKPAADDDHLALVTLVFPDTLSSDSPSNAPLPHAIPAPQNVSVTLLPSTENPLTAYSQDTILTYALPYSQAADFITAAQEIPNEDAEETVTRHGREKKTWIMKAAKVTSRNSVVQWASNAWSEFLDLLKNAETLDIIIMFLGYVSMHLTFVSLFLSMRRMGSHFWLAMSTLFSSVFAFLFGLAVTTHLGVPISIILLSEGLPFLVVTVGFEKNIILTRAVLSHAIEHRRARNQENRKGKSDDATQNVIQYAIQAAIKEKGFEIIRDYAIEILILVLGAASGVQGGLQQFCFLAAWILFFDCILLFTFYTAILSIKLEINRIKRHVEMRMALEDDGISRRVAENVAKSNNDWPRVDGQESKELSLFGRKVQSSSVPKFKVLMVTGFVLVNIINICTIPFRSATSLSSLRSWAGGLGGVVSTPPVDPFKVAFNGLGVILATAKKNSTPTFVTVLTPIKYELEFPSVHYALTGPIVGGATVDEGITHFEGYGVGGRMVGSLLQSLEDPVLSKWIIVALALSIGLNGYLFNVARWGIKDPNVPDQAIDRKELARAQRFNDPGLATLPLGEYVPPTPQRTEPATPAISDEEGDGLLITKIPKPSTPAGPHRSIEELERLLAEKRHHELTDEEVVTMSLRGKIPGYALEKSLRDMTRAVKVRRSIIARTKATSQLTNVLEHSKLPYQNYNWERVHGACCENVIGYLPLPVGVAGPLVIDGQSYFLPMATTEGVLVASTSRGCKAINAGGGAITVLTADGMTRGPCVAFETLERAGAAKLWLDSEAGQASMKKAFNSTSRFARLKEMKTALAGTNLYIRFKTTTGDAMGMNMISKGVEHALHVMATEEGFDDMAIIAVSGNYCTDKKAAAINWIDGRGKGIVAEAIIPADVVRSVLKSDVDSLVELNISKNLIGSAMAASVGGFNAHAANIVAAIFLATGQDPAQVVESSNCITIMKNLHGSLQISVSMPSIEVGTLGGGTILEPQSAMLDMLGVRGSHPTTPGENARRLARIIGAAVLAGELSLCSALAAGHLVKAHMAHNRSAAPSAAPSRTTTPAPSMTNLTMAANGSASTTSLSAAAKERARR
ncbi:3-hydroxy-3-methylglutaryl coenzyme A reductase [Paramyrothecium foliicola]|nr:3-hydroxy-3-methylglutaryl coenzyme A reductase [Paramyrothecium foliicola]